MKPPKNVVLKKKKKKSPLLSYECIVNNNSRGTVGLKLAHGGCWTLTRIHRMHILYGIPSTYVGYTLSRLVIR